MYVIKSIIIILLCCSVQFEFCNFMLFCSNLSLYITKIMILYP